jgi:hypothetical protein
MGYSRYVSLFSSEYNWRKGFLPEGDWPYGMKKEADRVNLISYLAYRFS